MAAYAALTSLKNFIHDLHNHPSPPISIDEQQVQYLTEVVTFLQEFLQRHNSNEEADPLKTRIADAAHAAEDMIKSKIVDRIRSQSAIGEDLYRDLQLAIEGMDLIKEMATAMDTSADRPKLWRNVSTVGVGSLEAFSSGKNNAMVGFGDAFLEVLERLIRGRPELQIIPITGMGGMGKTTLAQNLFDNASVREHFDIRAWTSISQNYNARQALNKILSQVRGGEPSDLSESKVEEALYKCLFGRRYLIVLDDMWSIEVWDKVRHFFPTNKEGSRVIVTTRQSSLASHLDKDCFNMKFLDGQSSWNLFSKTVFGEESFPRELKDIGEKIVRNCRGLPLSIVTIGGLLAKSEQTREYWEYIEGNINSVVNSEDNEYCLGTLKTSYNHLPVHLKPCFLHMGAFEEDYIIHVPKLIELWIAEGFLQPTSGKSLEETARENLKELVDRNLILVHKMKYTGIINSCKIHDLLRDLSRREAEKERFCWVIDCHGYSARRRWKEPLNLSLSSLLEACGVDGFQNYAFELANLRYLSVGDFDESQFRHFPLNLFWNLHSLTIDYDFYECIIAPTEIWNMRGLRHVNLVGVSLSDPPTDNVVVMENLRTLTTVWNFKLSPEVVKRIPNIENLAIKYVGVENLAIKYVGVESNGEGYCLSESNGEGYCLSNLECLHKLESFICVSVPLSNLDTIKKLCFPQPLKKLTLHLHEWFEWAEILEKIGSLPHLQKLYLNHGNFRTGEWETVEGQFRKLEFLTFVDNRGFRRWTSERSHFPLLKEIELIHLPELEEIPSEIGEIPTLQAIGLHLCSMSAMLSAKKIVEEQEELQGEEQLSFHVRVSTPMNNQEALQGLEGRNFKVIYDPSYRM